MTDYISRADAIEAVRKELVCDGRHETHDMVCRFIADVLLPTLPSAELPKGDLISRAEAIDAISKHGNLPFSWWKTICGELQDLPPAEAVPTVIRAKTFMRKEDFDKWAEDIKKQNKSIVCIPCDAEIISAEAVSKEEYEETDGVITINKQSAKDVGEIKHIIIRSPNYTSYFYNESMPISADAVQGEWIDVENEPYCECSVCGSYIDNLDDDYAFCPRCGAIMKGGAEDV